MVSSSVNPPGFERWWSCYPNRTEKARALAIWRGKRPNIAGLKVDHEPLTDQIIKAVERQTRWRAEAKTGEFRPAWKGAATWLYNGCYEDEVVLRAEAGPTKLAECDRHQEALLRKWAIEEDPSLEHEFIGDDRMRRAMYRQLKRLRGEP